MEAGLPDKSRLARGLTAPEIGIVHFGPGAFFRAFGAIYTDDVLNEDGGAWGIAAVSLRSAIARDQLVGQDCLYTSVELGETGKKKRVIGAISDIFVAPEDPNRIIDLLARDTVQIVTLTITEKGYCHNPADGNLNAEHPDIVHDLEQLGSPKSAIGFLVAGLRARREKGLRPFTLMSCDNLPSNGHVLKKLVLQFAHKVDPSLASWIDENAKFPSSMVDRITPATTETDIAELEKSSGVYDPACVVHEPFRQWVIEDDFVGKRPAWEKAGAQLVTSVDAHEFMKLRCLNGTHSSLAYLGYLAGYETIAEVSNNSTFAAFCNGLWHNEILPTLPQPEGEDLKEYCSSLLVRYQNSAIRHKTWQIAMDGSQKLPQRILGTISDNLANERIPKGLCLAVAAWIRYVGGIDEKGEAIDVRDPLAAKLKNTLDAADSVEEKVLSMLDVEEVFDPNFSSNSAFVRELTDAYKRIEALGVEATIEAHINA